LTHDEGRIVFGSDDIPVRLAWHVLYSYGWSPQVFSGTGKMFFLKINRDIFWGKNTGTICTDYRVALMSITGKGVPCVTSSWLAVQQK
jgi:hypothetical protein